MVVVEGRWVAVAAGVGALFLLLRSTRKTPEEKMLWHSQRERLVRTTLGEDDMKVKEEKLSALDKSLVSSFISVAFRFDVLLDEERVAAGLSKAMQVFPAFSALATDSGDLKWVADQHGAVLQVCERRGPFSSDKIPDKHDSLQKWKAADVFATGTRLVGVRLSLFRQAGVSFLSIRASHGIGDAQNAVEFLQCWSRMCEPGADVDKEPRRVFGSRVTEPLYPAADVKELNDMFTRRVGGVHPYSQVAMIKSVARMVLGMARNEVVELCIDHQRMKKWKEQVSKYRSEDCEYLTTFEVLFATLLFLKKETSAFKWLTPYHEWFWKQHVVHVACNVRGRVSSYPKDYVGNATFDQDLHLDLRCREDLVRSVASISSKLHNALRAEMQDEYRLVRKKDWLEAARALGVAQSSVFWTVLYDTAKGTGVFINSWCKYDWLDMKMGSNSKASCMMADVVVPENLWVEMPRTHEESMLRLSLSPARVRKLRSLLDTHADLPITIL